jgi:hypothetical protein
VSLCAHLPLAHFHHRWKPVSDWKLQENCQQNLHSPIINEAFSLQKFKILKMLP